MKQPEQSYTAIETAHGFVFFTDTTEGQKNRQDFLQFMADHYFDPHFNLGPVNVYRAEGVLKDGSYVNPGEGLYPEYAYLQMDKTPEMELVYYVVPDGSCGPCTVGFFRQKIIIPESFTELENFSMVYQHEYTHLKNRDNLVKLLCLIVLCIHWMNPAAYLLLFLYRITSEAVSDDAAVLGYSKDIVKTYAMLLVTTTPVREKLPVVWKNNFSSEGKMIKRRINYMMKKRKNGWMRKGIIAMVSALTIAASAGTVLAYEPMQWSDGSVGESIVLDESDMSNFDFLSGELNDIDFSKTDTVFVTENGIQIPIMDNDSSRVLCKHNMVNGYLHNHTSNSSGGCTVKTYTCQRCTRCGYLANAKYYSTTNYAKCPHK